MLFHVHCRAFSTLPPILSAISHFHSRYYLSTPTTSRSVTRSLEGAKRLFGSPSIPRKIITKFILESLISLTHQSDPSFVLFRTVWRVAMEFYGLLRFSEVSNLTFSDIIWTDLGFDIFIKKSKTDQTMKGDWVSVASQPDSPWCPVLLTRRYFALLKTDTGFLMLPTRNKTPDTTRSLSYNTALSDL